MIEAGTVGAVRFETIGVVDGQDAIVIEHVNRMAADLAPEWPTAERDGTYRIVVEGAPSYQCELVFGQPGTSSAEGMVATTMRIVNAVPAVCDAEPGTRLVARPAPHPAGRPVPPVAPPGDLTSSYRDAGRGKRQRPARSSRSCGPLLPTGGPPGGARGGT